MTTLDERERAFLFKSLMEMPAKELKEILLDSGIFDGHPVAKQLAQEIVEDAKVEAN